MSKRFENLDPHTTEFTTEQLADVIEAIVERVAEDYPDKNIDSDRLRKGLYAAHKAKPIRLIDLLYSCSLDFPTDVILGAYRHYDKKTDSMKGGWTAQHAEPHVDMWTLLMASLGVDDDDDIEEEE